MVAGERDPAERADAAGEQRPQVAGHEALDVEGVVDAELLGVHAQVVAVLEDDGAGALEAQQRRHLCGDGAPGELLERRRVAVALGRPAFERDLRRQVARPQVVCRRHVGGDARDDALPVELRVDRGRVAEQADRERPTVACRGPDGGQRARDVVQDDLDAARASGPVERRGVDLDGEARRAGHPRGDRLGRAHAAEPGGEDPGAGRVGAGLGQREPEDLVGALQHALPADVLPGRRGEAAPDRVAGGGALPEALRGLPLADDVVDGADDERGVRAGRAGRRRACPTAARGCDRFEVEQLAPDGLERGVVAGSLGEARVDDELVGALADVEDVLQRPQQCFGAPAPSARERGRRGWWKGTDTADMRRVSIDPGGSTRRTGLLRRRRARSLGRSGWAPTTLPHVTGRPRNRPTR